MPYFQEPPKTVHSEDWFGVKRATDSLLLGSAIPQRQMEGGKRGMKEDGKFRDDWKETGKKAIFVFSWVRGDREVLTHTKKNTPQPVVNCFVLGMGTKEGSSMQLLHSRSKFSQCQWCSCCVKIPSDSYYVMLRGGFAALLYRVCVKSCWARKPEPEISELLDPDQTIAIVWDHRRKCIWWCTHPLELCTAGSWQLECWICLQYSWVHFSLAVEAF